MHWVAEQKRDIVLTFSLDFRLHAKPIACHCIHTVLVERITAVALGV